VGTDLRLSIVLIAVRQTYQFACNREIYSLKKMTKLTFPWHLRIFFAPPYFDVETSHYRPRAAEGFFLRKCDLC